MISPARLTRSNTLYNKLAAMVGEQNLHIEGEIYDACTHDAAEIVRPPLAAITVTDSHQVPAILKLAKSSAIPIVARGAGTGYTGGAIAEHGGIVISFAKMNRILSIEKLTRVAIVEPGVITQQLADAAEAAGLFYPPDPASLKESTIGGNVAECAGGLRCKKYGLTKDYVMGIEGYDLDGDLIKTGYFATEQTFDLTPILIGSEGTLILITRIAVKLIDLPQSRRTFMVSFSNQQDAAAVVAGIMAAGVIPAVLEFMDGDAVACALDYLKWSDMKPSAAALLIELDGDLSDIDRDTATISPIVRSHHPENFEETADNTRREYLWTLRRSISKAITAAAAVRVSEDVCVPPSKLPKLVASLPTLSEKYNVRVNSFGHAGDGNLHVNFLTNEDTPAMTETLHRAVTELFEMTIRLDGTISGEHGIGTTKRDFLSIEVSPETLALFHKVKCCFDPTGLINPGKML